MLRTRDFILFLLTLFLLGTAITATVVQDKEGGEPSEIVAFNDDEFQGTAISVEETMDRQSNIERLGQKLANSIQRIEPAPSVEAPELEETVANTAVGIQKCLYPDDSLSLVPKWPVSDVRISVREGARIVYTEETIVVPATASSTLDEEVVITVTPLLQLPLVVQKQPEVSCVPSEIIGITNGGILMFNRDINSYRKIPTNALIGYARDGFPIYGVYEGEVDACGGYDAPSGYRYTISTERDYVIGCFVGVPQKFSL